MRGSVGADAAAGTRGGRVSRLNVRSRVSMGRTRQSRKARGGTRATCSPPANRNRLSGGVVAGRGVLRGDVVGPVEAAAAGWKGVGHYLVVGHVTCEV